MSNLSDRATADAILQRIQKLRPDTQGLWGKMNVNQMIVHLSDQLRCSKGDLETKDVSNWALRNIAKTLIMWGMKAPKGKVKTVHEFDQEKGGTETVGFESDQKMLMELVEWFTTAPDSYPFANHPAFGPMNKKEWGRLAYTHLDHHLSQFGV